jgi:hypothetical protein
MPYPDSLSILNKLPDRPHQMLDGNIHIPFPENLSDPMNADQSPFTNHFSASHLSLFNVSPIPSPSHFSPITAALAA